jgi:hypothetical protein
MLMCFGDVGASLRGTHHHMDAPRDHALSCARDGLERFACRVVGVHVMASKTLNKTSKKPCLASLDFSHFPIPISLWLGSPPRCIIVNPVR